MSLRLARLRGPREASSLQGREIGSEAEKEARSRSFFGVKGTVGSVKVRDPPHLMERLQSSTTVPELSVSQSASAVNEDLDEWPSRVVVVTSAYLRRNRRTYQIRANHPR